MTTALFKWNIPVLRFAGLFLLSVFFLFSAYRNGMNADTTGDYYIYWHTGQHFLSGESLYTQGLLDGGFTYPPFAALFFSLFALLPFHVSAVAFSFLINYGLWIVVFMLLAQLFSAYYPGLRLTFPLVLTAMMTIAYFWHNFIWMNANLPVLTLTLLGIWCQQKQKNTLSYTLFWAATFLKITPVMFLFFSAIKYGPKEWPKILLAVLPFLLIPLLFRGYTGGIHDWQEYYTAYLEPFTRGRTDLNVISLGIPVLLSKLSLGNTELELPPLLSLTDAEVKAVIITIQVCVIVSLAIRFIYDRFNGRAGFSVTDYSLIFLTTLLLPGRVWPHHHVSAAFIMLDIFCLLMVRRRRWLLVAIILLSALPNLLDPAFLGQRFVEVLRYYNYVTLLMLLYTCILIYYDHTPLQTTK